MTPAEIRAARLSLGLTPEQAAPLLGYGARSRISEIETGARNPSAAAARLLRAYLDGYRPSDWPTSAR
jgi:DNA-binding transcriptional regulator YiaG